ncbi:MAG: hypothetical protein ACKPBG_10690, partial [Actinomycetota bacterium]
MDLQFMGTSNQAVATANVKIAKSAQVIVEHFERHPDVNLVYASSDAADHARRLGWTVVDTSDRLDSGQHLVIDIGRSSEEFDRGLSWALSNGAEHSLVEDALSTLPWLAMSGVALRAIVRLRRGHQPARVVRRAAEEGGVVGGSVA